MKKINSLSIIFPLYRDRKTVKLMINRSLEVLNKLKLKSEIIIVDDGCPENSGLLAKKLTKKNNDIKIFIHKKNLGYGAAIRKGIKESKMDWIFVIDGDAEYKVSDLFKLLKVSNKFDIIITYRKKRAHSTSRIIISLVYNFILRLLFKTKFRDISTGQRLLKKTLITKINLKSNSPFFGAELAIKSFYNKYKIKEIGVIEYPTRILGGSSVTFRNIILTILEMISLYYSLNLKKKK
jgi:glycosyltransferase involved in cell wall biosynthesis